MFMYCTEIINLKILNFVIWFFNASGYFHTDLEVAKGQYQFLYLSHLQLYFTITISFEKNH